MLERFTGGFLKWAGGKWGGRDGGMASCVVALDGDLGGG